MSATPTPRTDALRRAMNMLGFNVDYQAFKEAAELSEKLERELAEASKDTERIDKLVINGASLYYHDGKTWAGDEPSWRVSTEIKSHATPRDAIDAARKAAP